MNDLNMVSLIGRLTRDAEIKYTSGGMAITNISLAVNRSRKTQSGYTDEACFIECTIFGKLGESMKNYLVKGKQIAVTGALKQDRWEKDGQKFSRITVAVNDIQLLGGGSSNGSSNESSGYSGGTNDYGNVDEITF